LNALNIETNLKLKEGVMNEPQRSLEDSIRQAVLDELNAQFEKMGWKVQGHFFLFPTNLGTFPAFRLFGPDLQRSGAEQATAFVLKRLRQHVELVTAGVEDAFPVQEFLEKGSKEEKTNLQKLIAAWRKEKKDRHF
jgi:hypothetical protein